MVSYIVQYSYIYASCYLFKISKAYNISLIRCVKVSTFLLANLQTFWNSLLGMGFLRLKMIKRYFINFINL